MQDVLLIKDGRVFISAGTKVYRDTLENFNRDFGQSLGVDIDYNRGLGRFVAEGKLQAYPAGELDAVLERIDELLTAQGERQPMPARTLEELRMAKLADLNTAFEKASQTAHCLSSAGFEIDANEVANRNIEGLVLVLEPGESTLFRAWDNSFHQVTKEQLETMRKEIVVNSQRLYQLKWECEAAIEAVETIDELNAIVITFETVEKAEGEDDGQTT